MKIFHVYDVHVLIFLLVIIFTSECIILANFHDYIIQLSKMRYATVSEFRGKVMVGIREFYEADGELRPGKKGKTNFIIFVLFCSYCCIWFLIEK